MASKRQRICVVAAGLVAFVVSLSAHADTASRQQVDVVARVAYLRATVEGTVGGGLLGLAVDYRLEPAWRLAGYAEIARVKTQDSDERCGPRLCRGYGFEAL